MGVNVSQPQVTGPAHLFVGQVITVNPGGTNISASIPVYVGTAEKTPRIQIRPAYSPVFNDISGQSVPFDWTFDGEEGFVTADLTRWNETVYAAMAARPRGNPNVVARGTNIPGDLGTLMITEGFAYPLWVYVPYAAANAGGKPIFGDMPAGYRFYAAWMEGPDDLDPLGTQASKRRVVWHCGRGYAVAPATGGMQFTLYDQIMSQISPSLLS